jgi:hypothetical protein
VQNGSYLAVVGTSAEDCTIGFWNPNVGTGATVQCISEDFGDNFLYDVSIEHPNTIGGIQAMIDDHQKVNIQATNFVINLGDRADGEFHISDALAMRFDDGTTTNVSDLFLGTPAMGVMTGGTISQTGSGTDIIVSSGMGYIEDPVTGNVKQLFWSTQSLTLPSGQSSYIYFTYDGILSYSTSLPTMINNIVLGRVITNGTIDAVDASPMNSNHYGNQNALFLRDGLGSIYKSGSLVSEVNPTTGAFTLSVGSGVYYFSSTRFAPAGGVTIPITTYYKNGTGGWNVYTGTTVNSTQYDDGTGVLHTIANNKYAKHGFYVCGEGANEKYFLVISQAEHADLTAAQTASLPTPPSYFTEGVVNIAAIIIHQGAGNIVEIVDTRPSLAYRTPSVIGGGVTAHGDLTGLGNDDHTQYLLVNGSRAMAGDLNMGTHNISNVGTINSISLAAHASRHLPNGADPLTTAAPVTIGATNAEGIANSFARSDHVHAFDFSAPTTITTVSGAFDYVPIFSNLQNGSYKITVDNMNVNYLKRDGTLAMQGALNMNGNNITNGGTLSATTITGASLNVTGTSTLATIIGTNSSVTTMTGSALNVTGTSTLATIRGTNANITTITGATLSITGTSTLTTLNTTTFNAASLSATTITGSSLNVTGTSTLTTIIGTNSTITTMTGSTLNVTGTSTLATINATSVSATTITGAALNITGTSTIATIRGTNATITTFTGATLNVTGTINGIVVQTHASRHLPGGADALTTAAALSIGTSNTEGTAASFSRSDHSHNIDIPSFITSTGPGVNGVTDYILFHQVSSGIAKNILIDDFRVFGSYYVDVSSDTSTNTTSNVFQTKVTLTTPSVPAGVYRVACNFGYWQSSTTTTNYFQAQLLEDATTSVWGLYANNNSSSVISPGYSASGFAYRTLTAGVHTYNLQYRRQGGNHTCNIVNARVEFWRVA